MANYVFMNLAAYGHITPTLPIVQELTDRGETVIYYLPESFRETVEAVGAEFRALPREAVLKITGASTDNLSADERIAMLPFAMARQSMQIVPQLVDNIKAAKPDCLVYNALLIWARLLKGILGVRAVGLRPYHAPREHPSVAGPFATAELADLATAADRELARLAEAFGQAPLTLSALAGAVEELTVVFMPREFQYRGDAFDQRFLFVGPSLRASGPEPGLLPERSVDSQVRIYVSLGTLRNNRPEFYRMCLRAFESEEWQVVMSVGNTIDIGALGPLPENFVVLRSAPQLELLPNVDAFVSHGGLNSTMESLYFGVPLVVVPSIKEQRLTAGRVQGMGLGLVLEHGQLTPETLREAVRTVACDQEIRRRVKSMQKLVRSAGGSERATEAIINFVNAQ
jgi:MGT family glycosyltransferase